jgi:hypothetical protein
LDRRFNFKVRSISSNLGGYFLVTSNTIFNERS